MRKLEILYTSDLLYFPHMFSSIYSLVENNQDIDLNIHIIESGFTKNEMKLLDQIANIYPNIQFTFYSADKLSSVMNKLNIPKWRNVDIPNARLLFRELNHDINQVLYLDSDTIIVNSLKPLLEQEIDKPIAAVKEVCVPQHQEKNLKQYYNSGVLLLNYENIDINEYMKRLYQLTHSDELELVYPDQDLLNIVFKDEFQSLDYSYNLLPFMYELSKHPFLLNKYCNKLNPVFTEEELIASVKNMRILHAMEYLRIHPWDLNTIHPYNEYYDKYRTIWDDNYEKKQEISYSCNPFLPTVNLISKIYFPHKVYSKLKNKFIESSKNK